MMGQFLHGTPFKRSLMLGGFSALLTMAHGCGQESTQDVSSPEHNVNQPVFSADGSQWAKVSDAQYVSAMGPLIGVQAGTVVSANSELTKRTQFWLDQIDASIRAAHPAEMANVPKPVAKVKIDSSVNAFVAPAPVCYNVKVKVRGGSAQAANTADKVLVDFTNGSVSAWPADLNCIDSADSAGTVGKMVATFNAAPLACKLSLEGAGATATLVLNDRCERSADVDSIVSAKGLVALVGANQVTVHTALFPVMNEKAFVGVIAHELGHYYRAHQSAPASSFDFYYKLDRHSSATRPVPDASLKAAGDAAYAASQSLTVGENYAAVESQKIRSELYLGVGSIIKKLCAAGSCPTECKTANTYISSAASGEAMGTFPFSTSADALAAYPAFETKALACLSKVSLTSNTGGQAGTTITWAKVLAALKTPSWPAWLSQLDADTQAVLASLNATVAERAGSAAPTGTSSNLDAIFIALDARLKAQDKGSMMALKAANEARIGQYTMEQEADEESAEWISKLGIGAENMVSAMQSLGAGSKTSLGGFLLGERDCNKLFNNGWLDANGAYYFVPIGDFAEVHHSTCYRMFNLTREIDAHHYDVTGQTSPGAIGVSWAQIQALGRQQTALATPVAGPSHHLSAGAAAVSKHMHLDKCIYAPKYR